VRVRGGGARLCAAEVHGCARRRCMAVRGGGAWLACLGELWVALVGSGLREAPPFVVEVVANEQLIGPPSTTTPTTTANIVWYSWFCLM